MRRLNPVIKWSYHSCYRPSECASGNNKSYRRTNRRPLLMPSFTAKIYENDNENNNKLPTMKQILRENSSHAFCEGGIFSIGRPQSKLPISLCILHICLFLIGSALETVLPQMIPRNQKDLFLSYELPMANITEQQRFYKFLQGNFFKHQMV